MTEKRTYPFIEHLLRLQEDRGALAALRRGLGQPPGTAPDMYRYVVPWLRTEAGRWEESVFFLVAALFGAHPLNTESGNFGDHFARTIKTSDDRSGVERRFTLLLATHSGDLHLQLRHAISLLKSKEIAVNWQQFFGDLRYWRSERRGVQKRWAFAFWRAPQPETDNQSGESKGE